MGASMGGLISLYALVEYPQIFGNAGCVSTHWPIGASSLVAWLGKRLPKAGKHRIYFDFGTEDLDAEYEPYQIEMDGFMQAAGYIQGDNWLTQKFVGAGHSELAWRERAELPLAFYWERACENFNYCLWHTRRCSADGGLGFGLARAWAFDNPVGQQQF